jgi:hypothetical protein
MLNEINVAHTTASEAADNSVIAESSALVSVAHRQTCCAVVKNVVAKFCSASVRIRDVRKIGAADVTFVGDSPN